MRKRALLQKDDMWGILSIFLWDGSYYVSKWETRMNRPACSQACDKQTAIEVFHEVTAQSVDNGWRVVYYGPIVHDGIL